MADDVIKLRLVIEVDYTPNGATVGELTDLLKSIGERAANDGQLTGETPAEVETWTSKVVRRA